MFFALCCMWEALVACNKLLQAVAIICPRFCELSIFSGSRSENNYLERLDLGPEGSRNNFPLAKMAASESVEGVYPSSMGPVPMELICLPGCQTPLDPAS